MSRRSWWKSDDLFDDDKFKNSIEQHNKRLDDIESEIDHEYLFENDYDYGWGNKFSSDKFDAGKHNVEFGKEWDKSAFGGGWRGYGHYRTQQLTYQYVQQMANILSAQHKVNVTISNEWKTDLKTRTLYYNPTSLVYGTKSELLATLLHEIGKLRYSTHEDDLANRGKFKKYQHAAYQAMTPFEELRVDSKMIGEYPSASEIYESQEPTIIQLVKKYRDIANDYRFYTTHFANSAFRKICASIEVNFAQSGIGEFEMLLKLQAAGDPTAAAKITALGNERQSIEAEYLKAFGVPTRAMAEQKLGYLIGELNKRINLFDYIGGMYAELYQLPETSFTVHKDVPARIALTKQAMAPSVRSQSTQEVMDVMEQQVFPHIEDLLDQYEKMADQLESFSKEVAQEFRELAEAFAEQIESALAKGGIESLDGMQNTRNSGPSKETTVPEWHKGDYKVLRDSVIGEIKSLVRKLTFLRRTEAAPKWSRAQRRGKLDMKRLYRVPLGMRNVFKRKVDIPDTVRSFAFSLVVDVSGSMFGARMVNTTRGVVMLSEVFAQMGIPFEIVAFSDEAKVIKSFDDTFDKKVQQSVGGMANHSGGGTNLNCGLNAIKLLKQPQRNKVLVVLTDGGVGDAAWYNTTYFQKYSSQKVTSMVFGLELDPHEVKNLQKLALGNGRAIDNAAEIPMVFSELLKTLIRVK